MIGGGLWLAPFVVFPPHPLPKSNGASGSDCAPWIWGHVCLIIVASWIWCTLIGQRTEPQKEHFHHLREKGHGFHWVVGRGLFMSWLALVVVVVVVLCLLPGRSASAMPTFGRRTRRVFLGAWLAARSEILGRIPAPVIYSIWGPCKLQLCCGGRRESAQDCRKNFIFNIFLYIVLAKQTKNEKTKRNTNMLSSQPMQARNKNIWNIEIFAEFVWQVQNKHENTSKCVFCPFNPFCPDCPAPALDENWNRWSPHKQERNRNPDSSWILMAKVALLPAKPVLTLPWQAKWR